MNDKRPKKFYQMATPKSIVKMPKSKVIAGQTTKGRMTIEQCIFRFLLKIDGATEKVSL
jgi:hypothetical protein